MLLTDFDYDLPPELIAQHPAARRDEARLLVLDRASGALAHRQFRDLADYLEPGDLLVLNDTQVIPARLLGHRATGGKVELLLIQEAGGTGGANDECRMTNDESMPNDKCRMPESGRIEASALGLDSSFVIRHSSFPAPLAPRPSSVFRAMLRCRGHLQPGEELSLEGGALTCVYRGREADGRAVVEFPLGQSEVLAALDRVGRAPLPPYIKRAADSDRAADRERYQTVYARRPGAIAAPTAGLHFTPEFLACLDAQGVRRTTVTLHVGPGTFKPVRAERIEDHAMDAEHFQLSREAAEAIASTRAAGRRIVAVGTTATRVLETVARLPWAATQGRPYGPAGGWTDLFIYPGFEFRLVDRLVTNFHLPRSTLLMLVAAFAGRERVLAAYEEAKRLAYRFYSYGDAMLML